MREEGKKFQKTEIRKLMPIASIHSMKQEKKKRKISENEESDDLSGMAWSLLKKDKSHEVRLI